MTQHMSVSGSSSHNRNVGAGTVLFEGGLCARVRVGQGPRRGDQASGRRATGGRLGRLRAGHTAADLRDQPGAHAGALRGQFHHREPLLLHGQALLLCGSQHRGPECRVGTRILDRSPQQAGPPSPGDQPRTSSSSSASTQPISAPTTKLFTATVGS
jgi:hypothetical protein